jgi:hypothetical protein
MTQDQSQPDPHAVDPVDRVVADHLQQLARRVDASGLIERVCRPVPAPSVARAQTHTVLADSPRWQRTTAWALLTTLAVLVAFAGGRWFTPASADAATVLRTVHIVHSRPIDRCYRVQFAPDADYWDGRNPFTGPSETLLWTRGDRFWADATLGHVKLVYGRDEQGMLWVSPSRSTGIELSGPDGELPEELAMYCSINEMTVPSLVENVLADFDLRADGPSAGHAAGEEDLAVAGTRNSVVWATLKPGHSHPLIASALLEIDPSGTLVRLILWTVDKGKSRGTVTFTLVETARGSDEQYRLSSHLDADAEVRVHQFSPKPETSQQD